jgi:hypothetical protein
MSDTLQLFREVGAFAENKDIARRLRVNRIAPAVAEGTSLTLDFADIELATQSFIHALLSEVIRTRGEDALALLTFKNCNDTVRNLIEIVAEYSQDRVD